LLDKAAFVDFTIKVVTCLAARKEAAGGDAG
jgi:hypothetical protein